MKAGTKLIIGTAAIVGTAMLLSRKSESAPVTLNPERKELLSRYLELSKAVSPGRMKMKRARMILIKSELDPCVPDGLRPEVDALAVLSNRLYNAGSMVGWKLGRLGENGASRLILAAERFKKQIAPLSKEGVLEAYLSRMAELCPSNPLVKEFAEVVTEAVSSLLKAVEQHS